MNRIERLTKQMEKFAGECVTVEEITGNYYVFGSELATLRIYRKYKDCKNVNQGYSANRETFYFVIYKD